MTVAGYGPRDHGERGWWSVPDNFFEGKQAAAILKHAILDTYVDPFTMKTGKWSAGHRVAFVDGYAGEGRYADGGEGSPALATELLINFSTVGLRRIAGHLYSASANEKTLARMDDVCGGDWWRETWIEHAPTKASSDADREAAEEAVVEGYATRLGEQGKAGWWTFEVRNRPQYRPAYHLVFFSRHSDGLELFGEALSLGLQKWRRAVFDQEPKGPLFDDDAIFEADEATLNGAWIGEIRGNLEQLLDKHASFSVVDHYTEVFGAAVGKARTTHLRKAWKQLLTDGVTSTPSTGDVLRKTIERAP